MAHEAPSRMDEGIQSLHLTPIMTTASTPATPGPSTPTTVRTFPLEQVKIGDLDDEIIPPDRPKSTPFPQQEPLEGDRQRSLRLSDPGEWQEQDTLLLFDQETHSSLANSALNELPTEIHDQILDHLFGVRSSASSRTTPGKSKALRSWGSALRHSRRREVSELALVSTKWRELVQERLYRHLKIKGTRESVEQAMYWFCLRSHLKAYVKHIEIWFPVFQQKNPAFDRTLRIPSTTPDRSILIRSLAHLADSTNTVSYQTPANNCTLEEVFSFVNDTFEDACVLTLEGGERKKPPMVRHFIGNDGGKGLTKLDKIRTLVCKGQWNIIRSDEDFQNIANALPNLQEWHGSYAKPKSKSYISMATILPRLPSNLTHLNICLEADYRREAVSPLFVKKVGLKTHFCMEMAKAIPTLEHLVYTGRVCHSFFDTAAKISSPRTSRLKSVDLIVKNICRPTFLWNDGSGITDMAFIIAFEQLVLGGVKSLDKLAALEFLRIRFIDLESPVPALNPYFQLTNNQCTGFWSDNIVSTLEKKRPEASFLERSETLGDIGFKDGQLVGSPTFSKTKPLSVKINSYATLCGGITIN